MCSDFLGRHLETLMVRIAPTSDLEDMPIVVHALQIHGAHKQDPGYRKQSIWFDCSNFHNDLGPSPTVVYY